VAVLRDEGCETGAAFCLLSEERWVVAELLPPELFLLLEDCAEAVAETETVSTVATIATKAV
jgi:hypothetical protein